MSLYAYRAIGSNGARAVGQIHASDRATAVATLRRKGVLLIDVAPAAVERSRGPAKLNQRRRAIITAVIGELAVLLKAGLPLDRALALAIENVEDRAAASSLVNVLSAVREGAPLSRAFAERPDLFSPGAVAMTEAGEANGRLPAALERLAAMLESEAELRRLIVSSSIYPAALIVIALGVILMMLLLVVPQFESLLSSTKVDLPASSRFVLGASRLLREQGLLLLALTIAFGFGAAALLRLPVMRDRVHGWMLRVPRIGELWRRLETARFARTLGALVEGEVPLPTALGLAVRTVGNRTMATAIARVAVGLKEGGGLTGPLAAAKVLPRMAIGFFRIGEESSQLGLMLTRLADVLDRDVRIGLQRLMGVLTPAITLMLGAAVGGLIASIMSAILGFNEVAISG
jgi:general secretion pathway protein F